MRTSIIAAAAFAILATSTGASFAQCGRASWYGPGFHGRTTANGERYNQHGLTAAHKTMRFGTKLRVTNKRTGKSVIVRVNDRGPYSGGRFLDLSKGAAQRIGITRTGVGSVCIAKV